MTKRVSYTLSSTLDTVNRAESMAAEAAAQAGFNEDDQSNIAMAVREATVNAVLHGNAYDPAKQVIIVYETTSDTLIIKITDQGQGLDPGHLPDPLAPENLMKGSGRGIFLIRAFMDEVQFRNTHPGTEITLIKHVGRDAANAKEETK
ncbi:MAG TPA: ATP-binding protein [Candidatus Limnocylindrales bacterium]|nr:ATP-binding protein [Candidatus Limnocylindrales bacterium]